MMILTTVMKDDQWEDLLRKKLTDELEEKTYYIPSSYGMLGVPKELKIEFEIEIERELRRLTKNN